MSKVVPYLQDGLTSKGVSQKESFLVPSSPRRGVECRRSELVVPVLTYYYPKREIPTKLATSATRVYI